MKMLTKVQLTPHALELFRRLKEALPAEIGERLQSSRVFTTHGSFRTLFLFDIWDRNQNDILNRYHFKYCLGYDIISARESNWRIHKPFSGL